MLHDQQFVTAAAEAVPSLHHHQSGAWPLTVEWIGSSGLSASSDAPLLAGETISIDLPGVGPVEARVRTAGRHRFTAEWCGSNAFRLRFLAGWGRSDR